MVARELRELCADIIGLQEASWSRQRGGAAAPLAAQLGFHHFCPQANSRFFGNRGIDRVTASLLNFTEGPAIVSRFPIVA
jgi:endonuclease/exonuclease/phosphatase family metal-dependent hydrolase